MEVDTFLEHFGVRGQKWGVRNSTPSSTAATTSNKSRVSQKTKTGLKIAGGAVAIAGAVVAAKLLRNHIAVKQMRADKIKEGWARAEQILKDNGRLTSSLKSTSPKGTFLDRVFFGKKKSENMLVEVGKTRFASFDGSEKAFFDIVKKRGEDSANHILSRPDLVSIVRGGE